MIRTVKLRTDGLETLAYAYLRLWNFSSLCFQAISGCIASSQKYTTTIEQVVLKWRYFELINHTLKMLSQSSTSDMLTWGVFQICTMVSVAYGAAKLWAIKL